MTAPDEALRREQEDRRVVKVDMGPIAFRLRHGFFETHAELDQAMHDAAARIEADADRIAALQAEVAQLTEARDEASANAEAFFGDASVAREAYARARELETENATLAREWSLTISEHHRFRESANKMWEACKQNGERWLAEKRRADTATAQLSALKAKVEALTNSLASAIAYIEADLGLDDPDTVAGQIAAMDLRTGETRTFDCMAARAILKETSDAADR